MSARRPTRTAATPCPACHSYPTKGTAVVCWQCTATATRDLRHIADHAADLDTHRARLSGIDYRATRTSTRPDAPLPYDARVSDVEATARLAVDDAAAAIATATGHAPPPGLDLTRAALWAYARAHTLDTVPDAPDIVTALARAREALEALVDAPADTAYLGACYTTHPGPDGTEWECTAGLYAVADHLGRPTTPTVTCPRCDAVHDVTARREWLLDHVADHLATMPELARIFAGITSRATLKRLAASGALPARGHTRTTMADGRTRLLAVYRVGDVTTGRATRPR